MDAGALKQLTHDLLDRIRLVNRDLGRAADDVQPQARFADLLDSMGLVEFLLIVARDCHTTAEAIEECVGREFGTVADLAKAMWSAGFLKQVDEGQAGCLVSATSARAENPLRCLCWFGSTAVRLPRTLQPADEINALLRRPPGWLERHAGIVQRGIWQEQEAMSGVVAAAQECLRHVGRPAKDVGALLVTSEAPPLLVGLAAEVHRELGLPSTTPALEIGGACTGFLAALWLASNLIQSRSTVLIVAVEAPSQFLSLHPGPAGEAAALFGDAAAACLVNKEPLGSDFVPLIDIALGSHASASPLVRVEPSPGSGVELHLDGAQLARQAVRTMHRAVSDLARAHGLALTEVAAVVVHGGNGRLPGLLARQLQLPPERIWSETARSGNLGSASLPVAWAAHPPIVNAPVLWTAVGAGLVWGAALTGARQT